MTDKPKYKVAAEYFGARRGIVAEELLRRAQIAAQNFPGPHCLEPHEVVSVVEGREIAALTERHLQACIACQAVVKVYREGR